MTPHYDRRPVAAVAPDWWRAAGNSCSGTATPVNQLSVLTLAAETQPERGFCGDSIKPAGGRRAVRMSVPDLTIKRERLIAATSFRLTADTVVAASHCKH